eukprot:403375657
MNEYDNNNKDKFKLELKETQIDSQMPSSMKHYNTNNYEIDVDRFKNQSKTFVDQYIGIDKDQYPQNEKQQNPGSYDQIEVDNYSQIPLQNQDFKNYTIDSSTNQDQVENFKPINLSPQKSPIKISDLLLQNSYPNQHDAFYIEQQRYQNRLKNAQERQEQLFNHHLENVYIPQNAQKLVEQMKEKEILFQAQQRNVNIYEKKLEQDTQRRQSYQAHLNLQLQSKLDQQNYLRREKDIIRQKEMERQQVNRSQELQLREMKEDQKKVYRQILEDQKVQREVLKSGERLQRSAFGQNNTRNLKSSIRNYTNNDDENSHSRSGLMEANKVIRNENVPNRLNQSYSNDQSGFKSRQNYYL